MYISYEEKKKEAVERLNLIGVDENMVIKPFKSGTLMLSEYLNKSFSAVLFNVNQYPDLVNKIKHFEEHYKRLVYHVQLSHFDFGDCYSFFYVSDYKEEWSCDRHDLAQSFASVYVWNKTAEECSEFGMIAFKTEMGGIVRIG